MISGIHHLNFLVRDLKPNVVYLKKIFQIEPEFAKLKNRNVQTATFKLEQSYIVLVCPLSEEGEPAKILASRGEGLFLVSFNTKSLEDSLTRLSEEGIVTKGEQRKGLHDWEITDLDAPLGLGPVFQLCQQSK